MSAGVASARGQHNLFMAPGFGSSRDLFRRPRRRGLDAPATAGLGGKPTYGGNASETVSRRSTVPAAVTGVVERHHTGSRSSVSNSNGRQDK